MKAKKLRNTGKVATILILATFLFISFLFIPHVNASELPFSDVQSNSWYYGAVQYTYEKGLFSGTSDTTFTPERAMTRGMFVTVLGRLAEQFGENIDGYTHTFTDVSSSHYANRYIGWASSNGIVTGYKNQQFGTEDNITREQMAVLIYRFCNVLNIELEQLQNIDFPDKSSFSEYAKEAIGKITGAKIMNGHNTGQFDPQGVATRAQVAQLFLNADFYQYIEKTPSEYLIISAKSSYTTSENIIISWNPIKNAVKYVLRVDKRISPTGIGGVSSFTTVDTIQNIGALPVGEYYTTVTAYNSEDEYMTSSIYTDFTVIADASTPSPNPSPSANPSPSPSPSTVPTPSSFTISVKSSYTTSENITISWTTSSNATKYGLTVRDRSTNKDVYDQYVTGNSKNIGKLSAGNYLIYMKAYNSTGKGGPDVGPVYFTVKDTSTYIWPTSVKTLSRGFSSNHNGLDIAVSMSSSVAASRGGTVYSIYRGCTNNNGASSSGKTCQARGQCNPSSGKYWNGMCNDGFGNGVVIKHSDGSYAGYAHLQSVTSSLTAGSTVNQGAELGKSGSSGNSTGPHLHFDLKYANSGGYWAATAYDPLNVLGK